MLSKVWRIFTELLIHVTNFFTLISPQAEIFAEIYFNSPYKGGTANVSQCKNSVREKEPILAQEIIKHNRRDKNGYILIREMHGVWQLGM